MSTTTTTAAGNTPGRPACRVPNCDGYSHVDNLCNTLATPAGPGIELMAEVEAWAGKSPELIVWEAEDCRNLFRTYDQAEAAAFAEKLRELAAAVERGAALLALSEMAS